MVGGGAALAMVCDIRVATPDARFGFPIARTLGNALGIGAYARLIDLIGPARTKEMIFRARLMDADEAHAVGLFSEIVEPEMLHQHVQEMAEQIAGNAPLTIQITKESVQRILGAPPPAAQQRPDRQGIHERGLPRGRQRLPREAQAELEGQVMETGENRRGAESAEGAEN